MSLGNDDCGVLSAFSRDSIRGSVYVEARHVTNVRGILEGIPRVRRLRGEHPCIDMVDLADRLPLLTMVESPIIQPMSWVRLKRAGIYSGDLGFVFEVDAQTLQLSVYVVPRIQLDRKRKRKAQDSRRSRPPAALFDADAVAEYYGEKEVDRINYIFHFKGDIYVKGGLLEAEYSPSHVSVTDVNPTQPELDLFRASQNESVLHALEAGVVALHIGDRIQVFIGTFTGLSGRLVDIKGDNTVVFETDDAMRREVYSYEIRKYFKLGDYVGALRGEFSGREGYIIELNRESALIYERTATVGNEVCSESHLIAFINGSNFYSLMLIYIISTG